MRLAFATSLLLTASATAYAEAPGETEPTPYDTPSSEIPTPYDTPPPAPAPMVHAPCARGSRLSIGLSLGSMSVVPAHGSGRDSTDFGITQAALRFRATPHLELEFELGGGRQTLQDGTTGALAMGDGTLGLRYRFNPHAAWNWWALGGVGKTIIAPADSSKEQRKQGTAGHVQLGVGVERRFSHFAIQAEMRWMSIGRADTGATTETPPTPGDPTMTGPNGSKPPPPPSVTTGAQPREKLDGAQMTFGVSYYF